MSVNIGREKINSDENFIRERKSNLLLPTISFNELVKTFQILGFNFIRNSLGSHRIYKRDDGKCLIVSFTRRSLNGRVIHKFLRETGVSKIDFLRSYSKI